MDNVRLKSILFRVDNMEIVLPNFQRPFVWTDLDRQKRLVASVLTCLPIGTLLFFRGKRKDFSYRLLGFRNNQINNNSEEVEFLLDGQQRLTVLANVFSNIIFDKINNAQFKWSDLNSSLKTRFFIKLPESNCVINQTSNDIFGFSTFKFPFSIDKFPNFSSADAYECISTESFNKDSTNLFYHPSNTMKDADRARDFIEKCADKSYIPLFMFIDKDGVNWKNVKDVVYEIAEKREKFLVTKYAYDELDLENFNHSGYEIKDRTTFSFFVNSISKAWADALLEYLKKTINEIGFSLVNIQSSDIQRAIDIYENINMGGQSLSVFELVIAKHSKVLVNRTDSNGSSDNLLQIIINELNDYTISTEDLKILNRNCNISGDWTASKFMNVLDKNENINSKIENVFLSLLCLIISYKNEDKILTDLSSQRIKKDKVLKLEPEDIDRVAKPCIQAIIRALAFLQFKCGVSKITEINYDLMLLPLSYFFYYNSYTERVLEILEYWYWLSIFSGVYDKDQNENVILDIKSLYRLIYKSEIDPRLSSMKDLFNIKYFNDIDTLLMKHAEADRLPKSSITTYLLHYMLSKGIVELYTDRKLYPWDPTISLEKHHIIPLATFAAIGQSTKELRKQSGNLLNSPGNFTYLTSETNKKIDAREPKKYKEDISVISMEKNFLSNDFLICDISDKTQIESSIKNRVDCIVRKIKTDINDLFNLIGNRITVKN